MNRHLPIVLCCGTKSTLFTNKLLECYCEVFNVLFLYQVYQQNMKLLVSIQIIKLYFFTKFHACQVSS